MKKLTQQYFIIPDESEFAKSRLEYQRNQAQLMEAFAAFAALAGLETRNVQINMYNLLIEPTGNDRVLFGAALGEYPPFLPYYFVKMSSSLYHDWCDFLNKIGLKPYPEKGFRHLCSHKGRGACFQEFTLDGDHYGCIMAPEGFTISGDVSPVSADDYFSALLLYINLGRENPPFDMETSGGASRYGK